MAISNLGKNFGERMRKSPDRASVPSSKEKKDSSVYRGKPYVTRQEIRGWLRRDEAYKIVPRSREGRAKLEKELFGSESGKYGSYIERSKKEPERLLKEIKSGKVKPPAGLTKEQTKNLLKKLSGQ